MRLLFAHPAVLSLGNHYGAIKAYRALVAAFAAAGHDCEVVAIRPPTAVDADAWHRLSSIESSTTRCEPIRVTMTRASTHGPRQLRSLLGAVRARAEFYALLGRRLRTVDPDWVICENGTVNLRVVSALAKRALALSVTTPAGLPFGPLAAAPARPGGAARFYGRIPKIFCGSRFVAGYVRRHTGADAFVQHHVAYGREPFALCATFDGVVTMLNPAPHKGGSVFAAMARAFPEQRFRAVESYSEISPGLRSMKNVDVVPPNDDLDRILTGTKLLLVPSMWGEGFGMACVNAMLRGIPVVASDDGGLPEATLGVGDCVPSAPGRLRRKRNGDLTFEEPKIDFGAWRCALEGIMTDPAAWNERSRVSRAAALEYVRGLGIDALCDYLGRSRTTGSPSATTKEIPRRTPRGR
jgi:Glycosyl transferases group 1